MQQLHSFRADHANYAEAFECGGIYRTSSSLDAFDLESGESCFYDLVEATELSTEVTGRDDIVYGTVVQLNGFNKDNRIFFISLDFIKFMMDKSEGGLHRTYSFIGSAVGDYLKGKFGTPTEQDLPFFKTHGIDAHVCEVPNYKD